MDTKGSLPSLFLCLLQAKQIYLLSAVATSTAQATVQPTTVSVLYKMTWIYNPSLIRLLSSSVLLWAFLCLKELILYVTPSQSMRLLRLLRLVRSNTLLYEWTSHLYVLKTSVSNNDMFIAPFRSLCFTPIFM
mgnify:CR=1 FL=1